MPVAIHEVHGLDELLTKTLEITRALPAGAFLWFRGVRDENYSLTPKIMRDGKEINQVFERERRLLTRFRQRSVAYWPAGYPQNDWEHLFAMQHFGMPTRLLDWSENLFVAAHFALADAEDSSRGAGGRPVVWCLDPIAWNRATPTLSGFGDSIHVLTTSDEEIDSYRPETVKRKNKFPVAIFGTHNSGRIVAQRGTFMVWGNDPRQLERFSDETGATVWKFILSGDRAAHSRDLASLGFGETMVFPEISSLASELSRIEGWRK